MQPDCEKPAPSGSTDTTGCSALLKTWSHMTCSLSHRKSVANLGTESSFPESYSVPLYKPILPSIPNQLHTEHIKLRFLLLQNFANDLLRSSHIMQKKLYYGSLSTHTLCIHVSLVPQSSWYLRIRMVKLLDRQVNLLLIIRRYDSLFISRQRSN